MESRAILTLTIISGLLFLGSFPPINLWWLSFISILPFIFACTNSHSPKKAILHGLIFGCITMGGFHAWILEVRVFSSIFQIIPLWILYTLYLSLFYGLLGLLIYLSRKKIFFIPILWVSVEYIKSIGQFGNSAGTLGYSFGFTPFLGSIASIGGVYLVSFILILIQSLIMVTLQSRPRYKVWPLLTILCILAIWCITGGILLTKNEANSTLQVSIIQANHAQKDKLTPSKLSNLRNDYVRLIKQAHIQHSPDMIALPETITSELNTNKKFFIKTLTEETKNHNSAILFGTPIKSFNKYFNSIAQITEKGLSNETYHKSQLMPFGEYWPFKKLFVAFGLSDLIPTVEYSPGIEKWPLSVKQHHIAPMICLEAIYPWSIKEKIRNGASLLYVASNHAWFFDSSAAEKHLQMSVFRSIEYHKSMIYSANNGISCFISPNGKIEKKSKLNQRDILNDTISTNQRTTPYLYIGEKWIIILGLVILTGYIKTTKLKT